MMMIAGIGDWTLLAWLSSAVAAFMSSHRRPPLTPERELELLILRERHPIRFAMRYPGRAIERLFR